MITIDTSHHEVTVLTLNRPEKRNALCIDLMEQLCPAVEASDGRVLIIRGEGPVFCAGLDLQEGQDSKKAERSSALVERMLRTVSSSPLVTIALVHGAAVAGGAGLMSACDFALAAPGTKIGYPETRRGLVAGLVMTFLKRQLRERDVRELLLLAELVDAGRACEMGLVNRIVAQDRLLEVALEMAESVRKGAPAATAMTKRLLDQVVSSTVNADLTLAHTYHAQMRGTAEALEGMAAFTEKRKPIW